MVGKPRRRVPINETKDSHRADILSHKQPPPVYKLKTEPLKTNFRLAPARLTPIDRVAALYDAHECVRTFGEDLRAHLANGIVICAPEFFAMGRGISSRGSWEEIHDPWFCFPREVQDAWYIYVFSGNVNTCLQFFPFPLRWIAWERVGKNQLRFLDFNRFKKRCA